MVREPRLTKFELEVMDVLWKLKRASVREIQEHLAGQKDSAYTTVQTIVYRLEEKGAARRTRKIGNAYVFEPAITRKAVYRRMIDDLLDLLGGSTQPLMAHLIESGRLTLDNIRELEKALVQLEAKDAGERSDVAAKDKTSE